MKLKNLSITPLVLLSIISLCGGDKEKIALSGKREAFIALEESLKPDISLKQTPVNFPPSIVNKDWTQVDGNAAHSMGPLTLPNSFNNNWNVSMGYGSYDAHRLTSGIVINKGKIFNIDATGVVHAVSFIDGKALWEQPTLLENEHHSNPAGGGVAAEDDTLYATNSFGDILALNADTGKIIWRKNILSPIRSAPTYKDGRIFVLTISNETYALDAKTGTVLWNHSGIMEQAAILGGSKPAVQDNVVIVAYSSGEIYALQAENGHPLWSDVITPPIRIDTVSSIPHIRAQPIINQGQVFALSHGGRMVAFDLKTGIRQWQQEIGGIHTPAVAGNWVFVLNNQSAILCLNRQTGSIRWANALPQLQSDNRESIFWSGPILTDSSLIFSGSNEEVQFVDVADGKIQTKNLKFSGQSFLPPVITDKTLFILTDDAQLYAWR